MPADEGLSQLDFRDYLRILRRRRALILAVTLAVVTSAVVASLLQTPVYEGKAQVLLQPRTTESLFDPRTGQPNKDPARVVQTEIAVLKSRPVVEAVRQKIGAERRVSVKALGQTDVIEVRARSTDPQQAATVANAYATAYIDFRRRQAVDDVLTAGSEIQRKIADLQKQIDATSPGAAQQRDTLLQQQALFRQKLDQLQVDAALKTGGAQLVTSASVPDSPVKPTPVQSTMLALVVGLVFGGAAALLAEYLDDSIKSKEELERAGGGLPVLGLIPAITAWKERQVPVVVSMTEPKSPAAEAYRTLRTSIQFMGLDRPLQTIEVTSPAASEGKTTTLANLGVALAQTGQRVVMVDCDLRRPRIHDFFGLSNDVGFTSMLLGDAPFSAAVQSVPDQDRLLLLPSGPIPPNPSELLASSRTTDVLRTLRAEADIVLLDCPPVLPVTDAAVLSGQVDGTLIVATVGTTTRRSLQHAHELLRRVDASVIGTVLNGVKGDGSYGYGYAYSYQYAYAEAEPNGRKERQPTARR